MRSRHGRIRPQPGRTCPLTAREQCHHRSPPRRTIALQRGVVTRSLSAGPESQTDARHGVNETLTLSVVTKLLTQPVNRDADHVARGSVVETPNVLRDDRGRDDRVTVAHEVLEQAE